MENTIKALQLKSELDQLRPINKEQEDRIMQKFRLDWNYHSNHLEGNTLTYGETKALILHGITAQGKTLKDHFEITGHNEAINWVVEMVAGERPLTENFIRELHILLLKESYEVDAQTAEGKPTKKRIAVGSYKTSSNHVLTKTGEMFYFATPEETPAEMHDLLVWYENKCLEKGVNPIVIAAQFHYKFIRIHPFDDGNGRTARILMNFILMKYGFPPCIIKSDKDSKDRYFSVLQLADAGNIEAFIEFIAQNVNRSLEIMIAGANGENIEEDDDLDKEIALLEQRLTGIQNVKSIKKSDEVLIELFDATILENLNNVLINENKKFENFYMELTVEYRIEEIRRYISRETKAITLNDNYVDSKELLSLREKMSIDVTEFIFFIKFNKFNRIGFGDFDFKANIKFIFKDISYIVLLNSKEFIEIPYGVQMTYLETKRIIKALTKEHKEFIEQKIAEKENTNL